MVLTVVPLLIHGNDTTPSSTRLAPIFTPNPDNPNNRDISAVGATPKLCVQAIESCADAFATWKDTPLLVRRDLFNKLAAVSSCITRMFLCLALINR